MGGVGMPNKIKHMEIIQAVINRLANNSFLIKGWCTTLVVALLALEPLSSNREISLIAYVPVFLFWILDGYFVWQERLFRALYDHVRVISDDNQVDFSMNPSSYALQVPSWVQTVFSNTLILFYGIFTVIITGIIFLAPTG
jgi:hypothetical protein